MKKTQISVEGAVHIMQAFVNDCLDRGIEITNKHVKKVFECDSYKYLVPRDRMLFWDTNKKPRHFTLPQDYNEALDDILDFYKEEEPTYIKDEWYYTSCEKCEYLLKHSKVEGDKWYYSIAIIRHGYAENNYTSIITLINSLKPATPEQKLKMFTLEAKRRGLVPGAMCEGIELRGDYVGGSNKLYLGGICIFNGFEWQKVDERKEVDKTALTFEEAARPLMKYLARNHGVLAISMMEMLHRETEGIEDNAQ